MKKVVDSNKITVSYRESSVPFSYLIGSSQAVGFSVDLADIIIDDVRKKLQKPNLEVATMPVTSQNRIPLLVNGTYDALLLVGNDRATAFAMDDILLFDLMANSKNPASLQVVGDSLQVKP